MIQTEEVRLLTTAGSNVSVKAILAEIREIAARPLPQATTLPAQAYTSEAFFEWETEHLFRHEWMCLAHASQIPGAGDFLNLDVLGDPLIVVRGKDDRIRVLSRVCPHRAMDIMPEGFGYDGHGPADSREGSPGCGHTRILLCPYHSWTFELDGRLKGCPEMQEAEGFCRDDFQLAEFRCEVWNGFVFVNLDGKAEKTVAERFAPMAAEIAPWKVDEMQVVIEMEWDCPFNWKVLAENFMESYHHLGIHHRTLQPMMPARNTWTEGERPYHVRSHLPLIESIREQMRAAEAAGAKLPGFEPVPGLSEELKFEWGLFHGFPCFLFLTAPDRTLWYRLLPVEPGRCRLLTTQLVSPESSARPDLPELIESETQMLVNFHSEDMEVCTAVQRGLHALGYRRGRLSHLEMPVWLIQRYLAARSRGTWPGIDSPAAPGQR